jgi:hypothetical protein
MLSAPAGAFWGWESGIWGSWRHLRTGNLRLWSFWEAWIWGFWLVCVQKLQSPRFPVLGCLGRYHGLPGGKPCYLPLWGVIGRVAWDLGSCLGSWIPLENPTFRGMPEADFLEAFGRLFGEVCGDGCTPSEKEFESMLKQWLVTS